VAVIKVLLAEDHTIVRKGIRSLLDEETNIEVVGEAENGRDAIAKTEELLPDVVLMDYTMPILNGLEATRQIKKRFPDVKIVILTMHADEEYIFQFLQAGASGYLVKQTALKVQVSAIQAVYQGESYLSPSVSRVVIEEFLRQTLSEQPEDSYEKLTDREREVFQLIAEGSASKGIADQLHISLRTLLHLEWLYEEPMEEERSTVQPEAEETLTAPPKADLMVLFDLA
jgi:DNA-binding NarL/FixJ family response regulator